MTNPAYHYELCAYISKDRTVRPSPFEGWATFRQIMDQRPRDTQYAVVRKLPIRNHCGKIIIGSPPTGRFLVWDLRAVPLTGKPPQHTWAEWTKAAAIMKAVMCHGA